MAKPGDFSAFLGPGTEFQGQLNFKGTVRIDCHFLGTIISDGKLILGKEAIVEGNIAVADLVVHGAFSGEAVISQRAVLHQGAQVNGNLTTRALVMEDGASLQGELYMGNDAERARLAAHGLTAADGADDPHIQILDTAIEKK